MFLFGREMSAGRQYAVALILGSAFVGIFLSIMIPLVYVPGINPDGSYYIEIAKNILAGKGFVMTGGLIDLPSTTVPLSLWPPGYPMIVAFFSRLFGVDPIWTAPRIDWACWALLPIALLFALRPILRSWCAYIVIVLVLLSPGAIAIAWAPMTDMPFLLLTVLSFGLLFRGSGAVIRPVPLLLSGVACGLAYWMRNVGIASFVAVLGAYAVLALVRIVDAKTALQKLIWWGAGAALIVIPLAIRNLSVFGTLQPYTMPPSTVSYGTNIRYYVSATLTDLIGSRDIHGIATWNDVGLLALAVAIAIAAWRMRTGMVRIWHGLHASSKEVIALLFAYAVAGAVVVIAARSRYQWGEFIDRRHVLQYDWVLLGLVAFGIERWERRSRTTLIAFFIVAILLVGLRFQYVSQDLVMRKEEVATTLRTQDPLALAGMTTGSFQMAMDLLITRDPQLLQTIRDLPTDTVLVSNYAGVLRSVSGQTVHSLELNGECDQPKVAAFQARNDAPRRNTVLVLFADPKLLRSGCWQRLTRSPNSGMALGIARPYLLSFELRTGHDAGT